GADTRRQVLVAVYYTVAQKAIFEGRFDDAMSIIAKVEAVEPRSQLAIIYALRVLNVLSDQGRARESLDAAKQVAAKAPDSNEKARALLGIAWVYAKFDTPRALEMLGESVRATNHVTEPRLNDSFRPNIVGRNVFHGGVAGPFVPVTPENTFRDVGARDFESALGVASELQDRPLRSLAILALSAPCLEQPPPSVAPKKRTPAAKEPSVRSKPLRERRKL
nr:tetratricopeptide repeat protein [Pyrinomonadaceae bacterium]